MHELGQLNALKYLLPAVNWYPERPVCKFFLAASPDPKLGYGECLTDVTSPRSSAGHNLRVGS